MISAIVSRTKGAIRSLDDLVRRNAATSIYSAERLALYVTVSLFVIVFGFPIYWMFISSIKPLDQIVTYPPNLYPTQITFDNYARLFADTNFLQWLANSLTVTAGNILLSVTISTLAGYSLTRFSIPQRKNIARGFIVAYMFPGIMLAIPYFILYQNLGLFDTRVGLVLAHSAGTIPFTTWLMWQFFQTVPIEWEESAWINGSSQIRTLFDIALPAAMPGIIASAIYAFSISWNDYTFALILLQSPEKQVMTTGIAQWAQGTQIYWGLLMSSATILVIPPLIVVFALTKYILAGFSVEHI